MKLSAVVITQNEEKNIRECLEGLLFCDEMIVTDSGSSDRTAEIARSMGAKVFHHAFSNFSAQKNFAIEQSSGDWVVLVDADERVDHRLREEIKDAVGRAEVPAFYLRRKNILFGRWMRFGGSQNDLQRRLARRGLARFEGAVHERIRWDGPVRVLKNQLLHRSTASVSDYFRKLIQYTGIEAGMLHSHQAASDGSGMKLRPLAVFFDRFFLKRGFLDGWEGFLFCFLSGYYEFVKRARYWELQAKR